MMSSQDRQTYDDRLLVQYLLGVLPEEEAERLDEQSIVDDELAARLSAIENDLVDAYVRNELSGKDLEQFKSHYLSSPTRRRKVAFAAAWLDLENGAARVPSELAQAHAASRDRKKRSWRPLSWRVVAPQWGFAAAAFVIFLVAAFLLVQNIGLRKQMGAAQSRQAALAQRDQELEKQLNDQRAASAESLKEIERLRQSHTNPEQLRTVSLLLPPPTRSLTRPPTLYVRPGTDLAVLLLEVDPDDFAAYRATLSDPARNRVVWRSADLKATSLNDRKMKIVSITFPTALLAEQNYLVDVAGIPAKGPAEPIAGYPFRVVLR